MVQHSQGIINDVQMGAAIIILRDAGIRIKNDITGMRCKCGRKWRDDPWEK